MSAPRIPAVAYRLDETELDLLQMSGEETDWSYTPVPTLSKMSLRPCLLLTNCHANYCRQLSTVKITAYGIDVLLLM